MPEKISIEDIPSTRTETLTLAEFLAIPPFPGHRNSPERALRAKHLHTFVPEHLDVEFAEYLDSNVGVKIVRITGNTRAEVWQRGLRQSAEPRAGRRLFL